MYLPSWVIFNRLPLPIAPARKHPSTFSFSSRNLSLVVARTTNIPDAYACMIFGRAPPWVICPWIMSPGMVCCRRTLMALYAVIRPSRALIPFQGSAAAWASRPKYSARKRE